MTFIVDKLSPEEWAPLSEKAHLIAFGENKPASLDRIDFACIARIDQDPLGYVTCRETDARTLYWQFGSPFPGARGSSVTFPMYKAFAEWCGKRYDRVHTLIGNENVVMLKMAWKVGFRIVGIKVFKDRILLEHLLEFADVKS